MDSAKKRASFRNYRKNLSRKLVPFACPRCGLAVLPKHFEDHCTQSHDFDANRACVWCWGNVSWMPLKKNENSLHLLACFRNFISPYEISAALETAAAARAASSSTLRTTTWSDTPKVLPLNQVLCPGRCFFDHDTDYIRNSLPPEALESFSVLPMEPPPLRYSNDNLNLAASCLQKYLETRYTHEWFHVMVKAVAFKSFLNALNEEGTTRLLPFSCWCDGGRYREAKHRQHRHMVAVAPKGHFVKKVWKKVSAEDRPCGNYPSKGMREIVDPMHLVHTLGYLSKRTSRCKFTLTLGKKVKPKENHFYILTTLPVQYRLPLVVLWNEGLARLMYLRLFQNVSLERVLKHPVKRAYAQWRQKIDDFYGLPRGIVLPVDRNLVPTERETQNRAHLLNGHTLHFKCRTGLDAKTWLEKQIRGGNCFYENVKGEWWTPRKRDQKTLNLVMPREYKIRELEVENGHLRRKNEELVDEIRRLNNKIHEMNEGEIQRMKMENERLKRLVVNCL